MFSVSRDSTNPTPAIINEYGNIIFSVSVVNGIAGIWKEGNEPLTDAISITFCINIQKVNKNRYYDNRD